MALTFGNVYDDPFMHERHAHGLQHQNALPRMPVTRDQMPNCLFSIALIDIFNIFRKANRLGPHQSRGAMKQVPVLRGFKGLCISQLIQQTAFKTQHFPLVLHIAHVRKTHILQFCHLEGIGVAEDNAASLSFAFADGRKFFAYSSLFLEPQSGRSASLLISLASQRARFLLEG